MVFPENRHVDLIRFNNEVQFLKSLFILKNVHFFVEVVFPILYYSGMWCDSENCPVEGSGAGFS